MSATIYKNPSAAFPSGIAVSESDLQGICADSSCIAEYWLGDDANYLKNRRNPGTYDLIPSATAPTRSPGYSTTSPSAGYDTQIHLPSQFTILCCFGYNPASQYVFGTGSGESGQPGTVSLRTETALISGVTQRRMRFAGAGPSSYVPVLSRSYRQIWRFIGMSVSATGRTDFVAQGDWTATEIGYNVTAATTTVASSPTLHIGAKDVYETGLYTAPSKIAGLVVITRALTGVEMQGAFYLEFRRRMMMRGLTLPPV